MNSFEVYVDYLALKRHFSSDYDYFKYNGKVSAKVTSFEKRKDKFFFERIARHVSDPHSFLIANLVMNEKAWIRDLAYSEESRKIYEDRERRIQSLSYTLRNELMAIDGSLDMILRGSEFGPPALIRAYLKGTISLETLVVVADVTKCYGAWKKNYSEDPMISEVLFKMNKYLPFLDYDREKIRQILLSMYTKDKYSEK